MLILSMHWPLILYILIGPAAWAWFGFMLHKGRKRMQMLKRPPKFEQTPRVTILIPAKDEGERIEACLQSALAQDYPNFEVIAVDDRSSDRTGQVMDGLAAKNPKLRAVHITNLPTGWTGKNNALNTAVAQASGEYLLFVDSDVIMQPDALSVALSVAIQRRTALFSVFLALESHTMAESLAVPLAGWAMSMLYLVSFTNEDNWPGSFANGQFMLFTRECYDAIGGHTSVKNRFCEDVEFARLVKPTGRRVRIAWGSDIASVRMYSSVESMLRGWARIFFACSLGKPWRILLGLISLIIYGYSAYPALVYGILHPGHGFIAAAIAHLLIMSAVLGQMYHYCHNPRKNALLFPIAGGYLIAIFLKALRMCATGKLEWRGTIYTPASTTSDSV